MEKYKNFINNKWIESESKEILMSSPTAAERDNILRHEVAQREMAHLKLQRRRQMFKEDAMKAKRQHDALARRQQGALASGQATRPL